MTEHTESLQAAEVTQGSEDEVGAAPRPRRRRRSNRGRGQAGTTGRAGEATSSETTGEVVEGATAPEPIDGTPSTDGQTGTAAVRRRRHRGGRGRRRPGTAAPNGDTQSQSSPAAEAEAIAEPEGTEESDVARTGESPSAKRRRRRRRRKTALSSSSEGAPGSEGSDVAEPADAAPPASDGEQPEPGSARRRTRRAGSARSKAGTKARPKDPKADAAAAAEPAPEPSRPPGRRARRKAIEPTDTVVAGPTRLRRGRQAVGRRRREPTIAAPRVTDKLMVITEHGERDQIAILEGRELVQHYVTRAGARSMVGNVYLGRVQNVLPGMEAAFIDVGKGRNAVLYAGEVNYSPEDLEGAPPRIEHVLKSGQSVLVQVTKDPIGGKGARLTAQISMPGRYLVLVPNSDITGISRRLPDEERRRLKQILRTIRPEGHGVIIRTAAEDADEEALAADLARLLEEWKDIEKKAKRAKAPATLYEEPELTVRAVRDLFTDEEFRELVTDSPRVHELVTEYLTGIAPDLLPKVRLHEGKLPVFEEFHVVEQIHKGLDRKVWLPSGGYIVIDRTEAMTVIDVNTGKSVGKTNLEETVVNTNVEAAREVARQLRLRDIGGMIIIDFIDMLLEQNKRKVIDALREEMAKDKTRSQIFDISPLGLLEVTRKRVSGGLLESFSETCPTCEGRGLIVTYEA
ncbi:MAG: Rne/Rng family ribonuclease [Actinobacteria bacterium]|nr:MAG: Rne/Rng family ribonuclease [Actinomycetota bacterium]